MIRKISRTINFIFVCFLFIGQSNLVCAQKAKKNKIERSPIQTLEFESKAYLPSIQSIQLHSFDSEIDMPILVLGEEKPLKLGFDDLRADIRNLYFSIEHCDADWNRSRLSALEYGEGYNEDRITKYWSSRNTTQAYTHYELTFPTPYVRPKISGNYLLKVYEDADKKRLILTHRFYVLSPQFKVLANIIPSIQANKRFQNQKLNLEIQTAGTQIQLPERELKIRVTQNQRPDMWRSVQRPSGIQNNTFLYKDGETLDFGGGNEFHSIDLRSLQLASERIAEIHKDTLIHIELFPDQNKMGLAYAEIFDENGHFFIRNNDRLNTEDETDYAQITFSLKKPKNIEITKDQNLYLVGGFNFYRIEDRYKLTWNDKDQLYQVTIPLKQGVYDYQYQLVDGEGQKIDSNLDGHFFQTDNTYQILVYYRKPNTTWDELLGFEEIASESSKRK